MISNPVIRIFFNQSRAYLLRTILMVFGIALGVSCVIAIDIAKHSVSKSFDLSFSAARSGSTHQIIGSNFKIPQSIFTQIRTQLGIYKSAPVITAHAKIKEFENKTVSLTGIDPFSEVHFRKFNLDNNVNQSDSDAFNNILTQDNGVWVAKADAAKYSIKPNDTITLLFGEKEKKVVVSGILDSSDKSMGKVFQGMVIMDISLAQEILGLEDHVTRIDLILENSSQKQAVQTLLPGGTVLVETSSRNTVVRQMSDSFESSLTAFSMLALFMGMFLIYNTVSFSVTQRRKLTGSLRALGATRNNIFWAVIWEVMVYALIGSAVGVALGIALGSGAVKAVCSTVSDIYFVLTVSQIHIAGSTLLKGVAAGLISSFIAAVLPARSAAHTQPVTLMQRSSAEHGLQKYKFMLAGLGVLIVGACLTGLYFFDISSGYDFIIIFLIFLGYSFTAPLGIYYFVNSVVFIFRSRLGVIFKMASGNIVRSLSRTSVLIASLLVVTSVYIGIDVMTHSFRLSILNWVDGHIGGDIHVSSQNELNRSLDIRLLESVEKFPEVEAVSAYNIHRVFSNVSGEYHVFSYLKDLSEKEWVWTEAEPSGLNELPGENSVFISQIFAKKNNLQPGVNTMVELETSHGLVPFKIAGIFRDYFMGGGRIIVSRAAMEQYWGHTDITSLQIFLKKDYQSGPVMEKIQALIKKDELIQVESGQTIKKSILNVFNKTFIITSALQILTAIVALTGILNSVMALLLERTRELGILRACGAQKRQVAGLLLSECGLAGFISGIMALPLGTILAWILIYVVNTQSFGWSYDLVISPIVFFQAVFFSCTAAILAGIYPAYRAGKTDIGTAIRME